MKKLMSSLLVFGAVAMASSNTYKIEIGQDSVIEGHAVKAGEYKLSMENGNAVLKQGKQVVELPARQESIANKVVETEISYTDGTNLKQIEIGGTRIKIVFDGTGSAQSGM